MLQRPLTGEPLALDLVNTQWVDRGVHRDFFDSPGGLAAWLSEHGLPDVEAAAAPLRGTRAALRAVLEHPGEDSENALNAVLAHGTTRSVLREGVPREKPNVDEGWLPAWSSATAYLDLLRDRPDRVRRCAHPACVLYFYDTSRNGTRRWCSMDGCGSRSKAATHYRRSRSRTT